MIMLNFRPGARPLAVLALFTSTACGGPEFDTLEESAEFETGEIALSSVTTIQRLGSPKCLDVENGSTASHALIKQYGCHGGANQRFLVDEVVGRPGQYTVMNVNSQRCIDIPFASRNAGESVQQFTCLPQDNQRVELLPSGGGHMLRMVHSQLCLSVPNGSMNDIPLQQLPCTGAAGQVFQLTVPAAPPPPPATQPPPPPPPPAPDFSLQASALPARLTWGDSAASQISLTALNGFNAAVALSQSGGPAGAAFAPNAITPGQTSTLTVPSLRENAALGAKRITLTGNGGGLRRTATLNYRVGRQAGAFNLQQGVGWGAGQCGTISAAISGSGAGAQVTFRDSATGRASTHPVSAGYRFSPACKQAIVLPPVTAGGVAHIVNLGAFGQGFGSAMSIPLPYHYAFSPDDSLLVTDPPVNGAPGQQTATLYDLAGRRGPIGATGNFTGNLTGVVLNARANLATDQAVISVRTNAGVVTTNVTVN
jgi:hypothetical protein